MFRILLTTILSLTLINCMSQDFSLSFEKEDKKEKNIPLHINIKSDGSSTLVGMKKMYILTGPTEYTLMNYSSSVDAVSKNEFKIKDFDKMPYVNSYVSTTDNVYLIFEKYHYKRKEKEFFTYRIKSDGSVDMNSKKLFFVSKVDSRNDGALKVHRSKDKSHTYFEFVSGIDALLVKKNGLRLIKLKGENDIEWDKTLIKEVKKRDKDIKQVKITNNGDIVVHYASKTNKDKARLTNTLSLYDKTGEFVASKSAESLGKFYKNVKIIEAYDGSFNVYGFYSDKKNTIKFNGISGFNFSSTEKKMNKIFDFKLDSDLLSNIMKEKKASRKAEKGIPATFKIRDIYKDNNGNYIVIAEEEFIRTSSTGSSMPGSVGGMNSRQTSYLINGDVLVFSINESGKILWSNAVLKYQKTPISESSWNATGVTFSITGDYISYSSPENSFLYLPIGIFTFEDDDKVYIMYNDNERNFKFQHKKENKNKKAKLTANFKKANTYVYKINKSDGKIKAEQVYDGKKNKMILYPKTTKKVSPSNYIVYASTIWGNDALGKLSVKNISSSTINQYSSKSVKGTATKTSTSNNNKDSTYKLNIPKGGVTAITNSSTISEDAEAASPQRVLKYKADEKEVEKYKALRKKFDAEQKKKELKEKIESKKAAISKAKEEDARHLKPGQSAQFDKHRSGNTTQQKEKTTPEEDYKSLFD